VSFHSFRYAPHVKRRNFSHSWKKSQIFNRDSCKNLLVLKSQIFNKDECKYLFLPFQLKNKACRFHSFIRMSMSCLLHTILQRSGISSTRERNSASFHSFRYAPLVKRWNFSHSWKKSQIFK
jgi:hypothetical protein